MKVNQIIKPSGFDKVMISANDISSWYEAVQLYEVNRIDEAIEHFKAAKQNSKMMVNTGCCYLRKNDLKSAEQVKIFLPYVYFFKRVKMPKDLYVKKLFIFLTSYICFS